MPGFHSSYKVNYAPAAQGRYYERKLYDEQKLLFRVFEFGFRAADLFIDAVGQNIKAKTAARAFLRDFERAGFGKNQPDIALVGFYAVREASRE